MRSTAGTVLALAALWSAVSSSEVAACIGDCDGDGRIAIDELVLGVNIALERSPLATCPAFDDGSGRIGIDVLVRAVRQSLAGCPSPTPTAVPTPTNAAADLLPDSAFTFVPPDPRGCVAAYSEIADPVTRLCIANRGSVAAGEFAVRTTGASGTDEFRVDGLAGMGLECFDRDFVGADITVVVDAADEVLEGDETNNQRSFEAPPPTLTPPPLCTATPSATASASPTGTATPTASATATRPLPTPTATATSSATASPTSPPVSPDEIEALISGVLNELDSLVGVATGAGGLTGLGRTSGLTVPLPCLNGGIQALGCSDGETGAVVTFEYTQCITEVENQRVVLNGLMTFSTPGSCTTDPFPVGSTAELRFDGSIETSDLVGGESFSATYGLTMLFSVDAEGVLRFAVSGTVEASCVVGVTTIETIEDVVIDGQSECPSAGRFRLSRGDLVQEVAYTEAGGIDVDLDGDGSADRTVETCEDPALAECFAL